MATATTPAHAEPLVLVAADSMPTGYYVNNKPTGILVDIINNVFSRAHQPVKIVLMPWAQCIEQAKYGKVDGIFSIYNTPERQEFLTYTSETLIIQEQAFFTLKDSKATFDGNFQNIADLPMGIVRQTSYGTHFDAALKQGVFSSIEIANSAEINIKKLLARRIEILPSYRIVALSIAKDLGAQDKIRELTPAIESVPSYLAFTKKQNYTKVISLYNGELKAMKKDGTYDAIFKKYLNP